jgi:hypothetical protein
MFHGRAPNLPSSVSEGGAQSVEVGDFPFLESIFTIFGKLTGVFPDNELSENKFPGEITENCNDALQNRL